jgi:hypothetical protein
MHQPLPLTYKIGVGGGHGEIIHRLRAGDKGDGFNRACIPVRPAWCGNRRKASSGP